MNMVKQSLYLCIGALLLLIGIVGAQSLWRVSELSDVTARIVESNRISQEASELWFEFQEANCAFDKATSLIDVQSVGIQRAHFKERSDAVNLRLKALDAVRAEALEEEIGSLSGQVSQWLELAQPHVGSSGITALPSLHRLEQLRIHIKAGIAALERHSATEVAAAVSHSDDATQDAYLWTTVELFAAVIAGVLLGWFALSKLHHQLGADASEVARVANTIADGDLSVPLKAEGFPDGSIMAAMARMQMELAGTVSNVRDISAVLADGAANMANENREVSKMTREQATAIQKTNSTITSLGDSFRQNAKSASSARQLADKANAIALRSSSIVEDVVQTMGEINTSSARIVDIIEVINGISFQTNLLALNAAVEAARAGEQGRGFAVVAGEVRTLAQNSAAAANEVKELIDSSVHSVDKGGRLVNQTGETMLELVSEFEQVAKVISRMSAANDEQDASVSKVGDAMADLDRTTQGSADTAQRTADDAERLKEQSLRLVESIAVFKVDGNQMESGRKAA